MSAIVETWQHRQLVRTLVTRDFIARYKQTFLGVGWSVIQPLAIVLALTLFLRRVSDADTHGSPYILWSFVGLLPWSLFSAAVAAGTGSLLSNQPLLNKVKCPREAFPVAAVGLAAIDTAISVVTLGVVFAVTHTLPAATVYWLPVVVAVQVPACLGAALLGSIVVVYLRDLRNIVPLALQLGLFVSPIAFGLEEIPSRFRLLYCFVNPVAPVIDTYRRVILYGAAPQAAPLLVGAASGLLLFVVAVRTFRRLEVGIADLI